MNAFRTQAIVSAFTLVFIVSCSQTRSLQEKMQEEAPPLSAASLHSLADSLGLEITESDADHAKLENESNRVLLFVDPDGRTFVNGKPIRSRGGIKIFGGEIYVPERLQAAIAREMIVPSPPMEERMDPELFRVVIDPGHGGRDPGAVSVLGFHEKDLNLAVARGVASLLRNRGFNLKLTRTGDSFIPLDDRAAMADRYGADLFVSIHADSSENRSAEGYTLYTCREAQGASREAARGLSSALAGTGLSSRGVREADYRVLVRTRCPAVLVEMGFISNPREARKLMDKRFLERFASILAEGVHDHLCSSFPERGFMTGSTL
ncbi:MAG: N-acetylmuramoyl-L-alanine amidase family protein [Planctomycetota bacterium]|jgi:N-acetylmuramoyl-L-alanine amidase